MGKIPIHSCDTSSWKRKLTSSMSLLFSPSTISQNILEKRKKPTLDSPQCSRKSTWRWRLIMSGFPSCNSSASITGNKKPTSSCFCRVEKCNPAHKIELTCSPSSVAESHGRFQIGGSCAVEGRSTSQKVIIMLLPCSENCLKSIWQVLESMIRQVGIILCNTPWNRHKSICLRPRFCFLSFLFFLLESPHRTHNGTQ